MGAAKDDGERAYDNKPLRFPMKPSPSANYCNLVSIGTALCYAHTRQACVVDPLSGIPGKAAPTRKVESQSTDVVHCVRALPHGEVGYLFVGTEAGIQVWDKQGVHLLYVWAFPTTDLTKADSDAASLPGGVGSRHCLFARGASITIATDGQPNICWGSSTGELYVLEVDGAGRFKGPTKYSHHTSPITAIGSPYSARQGRWTEDLGSLIVSAEESGTVTVWAAQSASTYKVTAVLGSSSAPAVGLAVRHDFVVVARLDGTVQVFSLRDKNQLQAEVTVHSRWLTCMDIHPTKDVIVTGAEDGTISVINLPIGGQKTKSLLSVCWMQAAIAGVAFCGPTIDDVAVVAYDTDELHVYKMIKST